MYHRAARIIVDKPVLVNFHNGSDITAQMQNVSEGGIAILYDSPVESGKRVRLRFELPDTHHISTEIICEAVVRNSYSFIDLFLIGMQIEEIGEYEMYILRDYIKRNKSHQEPLLHAV